MSAIGSDARGRGFSRRQALVASGSLLLACAGLGTGASAAVGDQDSWRFCEKCFAMFWDGAGNKGTCPAGGGHTSQGLLFVPHYDDSAPANYSVQYNWRFCSKCFTMFYNGFASHGRCPSGGDHVAHARMSAHAAISVGDLIDTAKEALADVEKVANSSGTAFQTVGTIVDVFV